MVPVWVGKSALDAGDRVSHLPLRSRRFLHVGTAATAPVPAPCRRRLLPNSALLCVRSVPDGRRWTGAVRSLAGRHRRSSRAERSTIALLAVAWPRTLCSDLLLSRHQDSSGIQLSDLRESGDSSICDFGGVASEAVDYVEADHQHHKTLRRLLIHSLSDSLLDH